MSKIANSKYYQLENTPLVHLLGDEILNLERDFSFHLFQRIRYYLIIDPKLNKIFTCYFTKLELNEINLEWLVYNLIVNLVRKDVDSLEFLEPFVK